MRTEDDASQSPLGAGAVHDVLETSQDIAPTAPSGKATTIGIESAEWNPAAQSLQEGGQLADPLLEGVQVGVM